jgi:hypothetical protein
MNWFEVDRKGLGKLLEKRGKAILIIELLQNSWDSNAKTVNVTLQPIEGKPRVYVKVVDDDPDGFKDLTHAFTLFAESEKKDDPTKRGRFNLGEKLVLSLCHWAKIVSTTGAYEFTEKDGRSKLKNKTTKGSYFEGELRMTREEYADMLDKIAALIPPTNIKTIVNGEALIPREPILSFQESLPTEIADEEGNLKKSIRKTLLSVYDKRNGERACIYEMGIPVVETDGRYHVNIGQKVPLGFNRDNVTPAYLRAVRTFVFNQTHSLISKEEVNDSWVREATTDSRCSTEAIQTAVLHRFGKKAVAFDPSDLEANKLAVSRGYTVIPGRSLSKGEWDNVRRAQTAGLKLAYPAGKVTPSPKPFSPDGKPLKIIPQEKYTRGMNQFIEYAKWLAEKLIDANINITIAKDRGWNFAAAYGDNHLTVNASRVGYHWFDKIASVKMNALLLHEFAHRYSGDHLSSKYHDALCDLGAKLAEIAANNPSRFNGSYYGTSC